MDAGAGEPLERAHARAHGRVTAHASMPGGGRVAIALVLSFGLHLLAIVAWKPDHHASVARTAAAPPPLSIRLQPVVPAQPRASPERKTAPTSTPARPTTPSAKRTAERAAFRSPSKAPADDDRRQRQPVSDPAQADAAPPAAASRPTANAAQPDAASPPSSASTGAATLAGAAAQDANGGFTAGLAKRQAGRVDRQLRGGKSGVPKDADTPWARFVRGVDDAYIDTSTTGGLDSYTSPDGVVIYRLTVGKRVTCSMTGSIGRAGKVNCPAGVPWHRED
jgi:hypothetical protein